MYEQNLGTLIVALVVAVFIVTHIKEIIYFLISSILAVFLFGLLSIVTMVRCQSPLHLTGQQSTSESSGLSSTLLSLDPTGGVG